MSCCIFDTHSHTFFYSSSKSKIPVTLPESLLMAVASCKKCQQPTPVQPRKEFMSDPAFSQIRDSIKQQGSSIVKDILQSEKGSADGSMDQAFFLDDRFEVVVDARGYSPQDIRCTITQANIEIAASSKQKEDNVERTTAMTRSYQLPKNILPERGNCNLSADGVLVISVPWQK